MFLFKQKWLVLFFFLTTSGLSAQVGQYKFARIDVNQNLSDNQITCFLKDSRGFMWIGTNSGLNRYNGFGFKVFRNDLRDPSSISNNYVNSIFEDPHGRIWVNNIYGTKVTDIYNPQTERFGAYSDSLLRTYEIPSGRILNIIKDSNKHFWFIHESAGIYRYNPEKQLTEQVMYATADSMAFRQNWVCSLAEGRNGVFWIILADGSLVKLNGNNLQVTQKEKSLTKRNHGQLYDYQLISDKDGNVWIYTSNANGGVFYYDTQQKTFQFFNESEPKRRLNNNIVRGLVEDNNGDIWVATDHGGINLIDKKTLKVQYLQHDPDDISSLSHNGTTTIYKDDEGIVWVGTFKQGISYYHENVARFFTHQKKHSQGNGLMYNDMNRFAEDDRGNLWLGANGGGLIYFDRGKNTFKQYRHNPNNPNSLSNDVIVSMAITKDKKIWAGTYYYGMNAFDGSNFERFLHNPLDSNSLRDNNIWELFEDSEGNLWIGTLYRGLSKYNPKTRQFQHYQEGQPNSIHTNYISAITEDSHGNIWVGTGYGVEVLEKSTGKFVHYVNQGGEGKTLSNNSILSIIEDRRGWIWIGTQDGLNKFDPKTRSFTNYRKEDGLPHNTILTILEDNQGHLWMSTPNGLSNMLLEKDKYDNAAFGFKNYDESDGLQGRQFNENAAFKTSRGELIFGGANGFNIFKPEDIGLNRKAPQVVLSDFLLFNKSVGIGEEVDGQVLLKESIITAKEIALAPNQNVFSIEFAALSYIHSEKCTFKYMLEGFNKEWLTADGRSNKVTYTNLDPGTYTFRVKAANNDGVWSEQDASINITVLPPFWKTIYAYILYISVVVGVFILYNRNSLQRERMKFQIEQERQEAQRMHELDLMKINFFTNVSHEFRTPLTLIITPLEKLMKTKGNEPQNGQFLMIHRNAKRLLNLVNQLLDFRKMEVKELRFNPSEGDIVVFVRDTVEAFSDLSEKKGVDLAFQSEVEQLDMLFDQDKLERIMFNLLSNAFKFTPNGGKVTVTISLNPENQYLIIKVQDTGIGIAPELHEKVFERFFQNKVPDTLMNQGSGIGLAITREFVRIHGGEIKLESSLGKGSAFSIEIPMVNLAQQNADLVMEEEPLLQEDLFDPIESNSSFPYVDDEALASKRPTVLVIDDNEDLRLYLRDNLKDQYAVIEAADGSLGWNQVLAHVPDLVVSDVMMPEMDGIELCKLIKSDPRTSHIPVILLTARISTEQRMEGYEIGADDYVPKPFNIEILQVRVKNLIAQRELMRKAMSKRVIEVQPSEMQITSLDEKLIKKAVELVEKNVADPDFSVEHMSHELGMSRVYLYKKLMAITGKPPTDFIRTIRLKRAAQLLEKSQLTVSEVAYEVGFNNPKHFSKCFKEEFKVLPSAYISGQRA